MQSSTLDAFLAAQGYGASAEDFVAAVKAQSAQLSDEELAAVAGGANGYEAMRSVFSFGIACAYMYRESRRGDGFGSGGEHGCHLCHDKDWTDYCVPTEDRPFTQD